MHTTTPGHGGSPTGRARKYGTGTGGIVGRVDKVRLVGEPLRIGIYVPQLAFDYPDLLARAQQCEELGFDSFWCFDHLYGPELPTMPAFEGWTLATALLAQTTRIRVGHMVLCATFRHPALLGKMATTLDAISGGRLNVGVGQRLVRSGAPPGRHPVGHAGRENRDPR
jgi:alkanesulfonate monooxygenase SsuD/methylene tetrahydromethanopterin reductase-like flavin-dependent oxidoreductase (luciferase family)